MTNKFLIPNVHSKEQILKDGKESYRLYEEFIGAHKLNQTQAFSFAMKMLASLAIEMKEPSKSVMIRDLTQVLREGMMIEEINRMRQDLKSSSKD